MSLFSPRSATNSSRNNKLLGFRVQTSIYGVAIPIVYGQARLAGNVIWTGDWKANPVKAAGGGKGGGGKGSGGGKYGGSASQQYTYQTAIQIALCQGLIGGILQAWLDKSQLILATSTENYTVAGGGGSHAVANQPYWYMDHGVARDDAYSVVVNDYGSPGSVTLSGTQGTPMLQVVGAPGPGQFSVVTGTYTFNAAEAGKQVQITYSWAIPSSANSGQPIANLALTLFNGAQGQSPWSYLTTNHPDQAIGYSEISYVANSVFDLGSSGLVPNLSFEIAGIKQFGGGIVDAEPSAVIADMLANPLYGAGFPVGNLGSLTELANYCIAHSLFISPVLDSQRSAASWIGDLLVIANAEAVWSEGILKFRSRGDTTAVANGATFTPNTAPIYNLNDDDFLASNGGAPIILERPTVRDAFNSYALEWSNRNNGYNAETVEEKDDWAIRLYGLRKQSIVQLHAICDHATAAMVASTELKKLVYVRCL